MISCLGLLGLASFATELRNKEIGIRKVMGASAGRIVVMLCREFTRLVYLASLIALLAAYFGINQWLQSFAFRIHPVISLFILSMTLAFGVAVFTVSLQALKAALDDPVDALKYE